MYSLYGIYWVIVYFLWLYIWISLVVFKGVLYVVCTIEERGKKVREMCSVKIDVIYLCQL